MAGCCCRVSDEDRKYVMSRCDCYYRKICKVKGVNTFHLICMIGLRSELMFNTVALNEHQLMQEKKKLERRVSYSGDFAKTS